MTESTSLPVQAEACEADYARRIGQCWTVLLPDIHADTLTFSRFLAICNVYGVLPGIMADIVAKYHGKGIAA